MRGEKIEVRHRLVCAGDELIDLIRFCIAAACRSGSELVVVGTRRSAAARSKVDRQPFDSPQAPGYSRREKRIEESISMRQDRPSIARRARQPMLNARSEFDRPERGCISERARKRRISVEQRAPENFSAASGRGSTRRGRVA